MMDIAGSKDLYLSHFARLEKGFVRNGGSRIHGIREAAISSFAKLGFPTTRHEEWKYTNTAPILRIPFKPAEYDTNGLGPEALEEIPFGKLAENQVVFVNGHYSAELSSVPQMPSGVKIGGLAGVLDHDPAAVEPYLAQYASYADHCFVALNTAFMEDGAFVFIPKGTVLREPIYLLFLSTARGEATVSYPRNLILVGDECQVTIVECYTSFENGVYFTDAVTEIVIGENAVVEHCKLQRESDEAFHVAVLQVRQDRSSSFVSHSFALGGALVRNEVRTVLQGEGGECTLNGLYMVAGQRHVDNHTRIDHVKPHCTSRELYKGVLDGQARGVFDGKIYVHETGQKTDASQTNKNLLLSEEASVDTKPQLEIHNNDVKCTHGSTIGQLDREAIFYLRARGISLEAARSLLTYAFASEIVSRVKIEPVRARLDHLLATRFQDNAPRKEIV